MLNGKTKAAVDVAEFYLAKLEHRESCSCSEDDPCGERVAIVEQMEIALGAYSEIEGSAGDQREVMPGRRKGYNQKLRCGGMSLYLRTGEYADGRLGEVFVDVSKQGATLRSLFSCFSIAVSLGLQHGVPLDEFVDAFVGTKFEPQGWVEGHERIRSATSLIDLLFHDLALSYGSELPPASGGRRTTDV